jgi:hypothetical protein
MQKLPFFFKKKLNLCFRVTPLPVPSIPSLFDYNLKHNKIQTSQVKYIKEIAKLNSKEGSTGSTSKKREENTYQTQQIIEDF